MESQSHFDLHCIEHFFTLFLVICSSFGKYLFRSCARTLTGLLVLLLSFLSSLLLWILILCQKRSWQGVPSYSACCLSFCRLFLFLWSVLFWWNVLPFLAFVFGGVLFRKLCCSLPLSKFHILYLGLQFILRNFCVGWGVQSNFHLQHTEFPTTFCWRGCHFSAV